MEDASNTLGLSGLDPQRSISRGTKSGTQNDVGGTATRCRVTSLGQRSPGIALQGGCDEFQDAQSMHVMPNPSHMSCVPSGHMCTIHRPSDHKANQFSCCPERACTRSICRLRATDSLDLLLPRAFAFAAFPQSLTWGSLSLLDITHRALSP